MEFKAKVDTTYFVNPIDKVVYQIYESTKEEIIIIESN